MHCLRKLGQNIRNRHSNLFFCCMLKPIGEVILANVKYVQCLWEVHRPGDIALKRHIFPWFLGGEFIVKRLTASLELYELGNLYAKMKRAITTRTNRRTSGGKICTMPEIRPN
uniref:Uncharacterized protein n=1 Tax=Rhizophora mucronata TaxID=61149 RepID=A0A2P2MY92_RHIMU